MKKISALLVAAILLLSQSSVWAVWEGNAGVGSSGNFPGGGMYALSDMFPKNTMIDIQNLETGLSVRAVVVGFSGVPGLVASVSPEVAQSLNIKEGSVSRVRISVPLDVAEISVRDLTAASDDGLENKDPDVNPAALVAAEADAPASASEPVAAPVVGEYAETAPVPPAEEDASEIASAPPVVPAEEEPVAELAAAQSAPVAPAPAAEPVPVVTPVPVELEEAAELPPPSVYDDEIRTVPPIYETDGTAPVASDSAVAVVPPIPEKEAEVAADAPVMEVEEIALVPAEMNPPPESGDAAVPEVAPIAAAEPSVENEDAFVPVVSELGPVASVPAEESGNPDVAVVPAVEQAESAAVPADEPEVAVVVAPEPVGEDAELSAEESLAEEFPAEEGDVYITEYVPAYERTAEESLSDADYAGIAELLNSASLTKGYYVQIGTYSKFENVQKIVDSYAGKYPISFVDAASPGVKKILVGSLAADETGAVLEFFQKEGFKDAFVYVIN